MTSRKVIVIVAQGRSGSTLMLRVLNKLPHTNIGGETGGSWSHLCAFYYSMLAAIEKGGPRTHAEIDKHAFPAWYTPFTKETLQCHIRTLFYSIYNTSDDTSTIGIKEITYGQNQTYEEFAKEIDFFKILFPEILILFNVRQTDDIMKSGWWKNWSDRESCRTFIDGIREKFERYYQEHPSYCHMFEYEWWHSQPEKVTQLMKRIGVEKEQEWKRELEIRKDFE